MSQLRTSVLLSALVACGDGGGPPGDTTPDTVLPDAPPDGPPPPVTVHIRHRLLPAPDVPVVFFASDDTILAQVTTDATGTATTAMPEGGKVVAATTDTGYLWLGVEPGDDLALDLGPTTTEDTTVIVPAVANTTAYHVETGCTEGFATETATTTFVLASNPGCTTADVVVYRQVIGTIVEAFVAKAQPLAGGATLDLSAQPYAAMADHAIAVTGIPANVPSVFLEGSLALGIEPSLGRFGDNLAPTSGMATVTGKLAASDAAVVELVAARIADSSRLRAIARRGGSGPIAFDQLLLPEVSSPLFAGRVLTWTQGSGLPIDGVVGDLRFGAQRWLAVGPTATSLAIPPLPAALAAIDPGNLTFEIGQVRVFAVTGGYDAVRGRMLAARSLRNVLPGDGQLVTSESDSIAQ